jgi:hypothetical protein
MAHQGGDFGSPITSNGNHPAVFADDIGGMFQQRLTIAGRNGIFTGPTMEPDGVQCGRRAYGMFCWVADDGTGQARVYQLLPPGYKVLGSDAARRAALADNNNWVEWAPWGVTSGGGGTDAPTYRALPLVQMRALKTAAQISGSTTYRITNRAGDDVVVDGFDSVTLKPAAFTIGSSGLTTSGTYNVDTDVFLEGAGTTVESLDYQAAVTDAAGGDLGYPPPTWYRLINRLRNGVAMPDVLVLTASPSTFRPAAVEMRPSGPVEGIYTLENDSNGLGFVVNPSLVFPNIGGDPRDNPALDLALSAIEDALAEREYLLVAGANITITRDPTTKRTTIAATGGGGGGSATWGSIGGTLSAQTDLNTALNARLNASANNSALAGTGEVFSTVDAGGRIWRAAATTGSASVGFSRTTGTTVFTTAGTTSSDIGWQVKTPGGTTLMQARGDGFLEVLGAGGNIDFSNSGSTITFVTGSTSALSFQAGGAAYMGFNTSTGAESVDVFKKFKINRGLGYPLEFDQGNGAPQVTGATPTIVHTLPLAAASGGQCRRMRLVFKANAETADGTRLVAAEADLTIIRDTAGLFSAPMEGGTTPTVTNRKNSGATATGGFSVSLNATTNSVDILWTGEASQTYNIAVNVNPSQR